MVARLVSQAIILIRLHYPETTLPRNSDQFASGWGNPTGFDDFRLPIGDQDGVTMSCGLEMDSA